ncbi:MAG: ribosome-binding factor A [Betaproteobacteria bacterium SG8_40]|nr:MAG: ribosome-binding factor A [Betaproteobacteria bacterium SG8_40]
MGKNTSRAGRLADQIQRELAELIRGELKDPRVELVTVTDVELSGDNQHAQVFFTTLRGEGAVQPALDGLHSASGLLRSRLAKALRTRTVPELHFVYDESIERGDRLSRLIEQAVGDTNDER